MFEDIYKDEYEKLSKEVKDLVIKLVLENVRKPRSYFNGIIDSCAPILELVRSSSKELNEALDRESEKVAAYYEEERATADLLSHEQ